MDDLLHDSYAVQHIRTLIHNYLTNEIKYPVKFLQEFTNGCSAQYKSKHCMGSHVLLSNKDFGYLTKSNYFEISHAKGEQDAAGAHIKQRAAMAVFRNEVIIQSGKDLFEFLSSKFSKPVGENAELKCRKFFCVDQRETVRKERKFTDVSENRKIHCVTSNLDSSCLLTNTRSCYCQNCLQGESGNCCNVVYMDEWRTVEIELQNEPGDKVTRSKPLSDVNRTEMIAEMATTDRVAPLAAEGDPNYDYHLLKVTSDGIQDLKNIETDNYGTTEAAGSKVLRGYFFVRENLLDVTHKLEASKSAIVHIRQ